MHPLFAALRIDNWILKPYKLPKQVLEPIQEKSKDRKKPHETGPKKEKKGNKVVK